MNKLIYSFPWEIGASGIGYTAWSHVEELGRLGIPIVVFAGQVKRAFSSSCIDVRQTRSVGRFKIPAKAFGGMDRAARFHDWRVARHLRRNSSSVLAFHGWPTASELSIKAAKSQNISTFLERPNAHTRLAYEVAEQVAVETGIPQSKKASHHKRDDRLQREEREYEAADYLLCPSDFVRDSFLRYGFAPEKLLRHQYGYSPERFQLNRKPNDQFSAVFVGNDAARKGLHNILQAWWQSKACGHGQLHIFGRIDEVYLSRIRELLDTPGVQFHGFSTETPSYLNAADVFLLSSYEEGSALVTYEARAAGCVLLVSSACGAVAEHNVNALIHSPGDVAALSSHIDSAFGDRNELERLRQESLQTLDKLTWEYAAKRLADIYHTYSGHSRII